MAGIAVMDPKRKAARLVTDVTVMLMPPERTACCRRSCTCLELHRQVVRGD